jgi:hypothetical protein
MLRCDELDGAYKICDVPRSGPLNQAQILIRKIRNKAAGTIGEVSLLYDNVSGRFDNPGGTLGQAAGASSIDFSASAVKNKFLSK